LFARLVILIVGIFPPAISMSSSIAPRAIPSPTFATCAAKPPISVRVPGSCGWLQFVGSNMWNVRCAGTKTSLPMKSFDPVPLRPFTYHVSWISISVTGMKPQTSSGIPIGVIRGAPS
jgi:hypothetical protein